MRHGHTAVTEGGREPSAVYYILRFSSSSDVLQSVTVTEDVRECCTCLNACSLAAVLRCCRRWSTKAAWSMLEMHTCVAW